MNLYIGKGIRFVILPEDCNKISGGYWRRGFYYPEVGYYYGYIEPLKSRKKARQKSRVA